jgi:hypothetical protein
LPYEYSLGMEFTEKSAFIKVFDYWLPISCPRNEFSQPLSSNGPCGYVNILFHFTVFFLWIPFNLQAVQIHSANGVKLLEAWRGVLSSTPPYK